MRILLILFFFILSAQPALAQQGCCSWHGGVCGSSCCDGSALSAKCGGGGYIPPSINSTIQRIQTNTYKTPEYCGSGETFSTYLAAQQSLEDNKTEIEEPLKKRITTLESTNESLTNKVWLNLILFILTPILVYFRHGNEWIKILLSLMIFAILWGGFIFLIP